MELAKLGFRVDKNTVAKYMPKSGGRPRLHLTAAPSGVGESAFALNPWFHRLLGVLQEQSTPPPLRTKLRPTITSWLASGWTVERAVVP
jgi:hypothetical protein